ncbi:MAG: hypothetical protein ACYDB2_06325 [Acidimicrobiales bacterium]
MPTHETRAARRAVGPCAHVGDSVQTVLILLRLAAPFVLEQKGPLGHQGRGAYISSTPSTRFLETNDPLLAAVGPVLAHDLNVDTWRLLASSPPRVPVDVRAGAPIGTLSSRVQYDRAIRGLQCVVLARSRSELALTLQLVVLRSSESSSRLNDFTPVTLLLALLLCSNCASLRTAHRCAVRESVLHGRDVSKRDGCVAVDA